ncbi:MAG: RNA polymerase sigma factor [Cyclobacteriaceae bacterium]
MIRTDFQTNEIRLWNNFRKGDVKAYDQIFQLYAKKLYNYGLKLTKHADLIEDSIQELFIDLWEKRSKVNETDSIEYYLYKSLRRRIIRLIQTHSQIVFSDLYPAGEENYFDLEIDTEAILNSELHHFNIDLLVEAINALSPKQKEIIYLRYYSNLSFEEISEVMLLSKKASYNLMFKTINTLRKIMQNSKVPFSSLLILNYIIP